MLLVCYYKKTFLITLMYFKFCLIQLFFMSYTFFLFVLRFKNNLLLILMNDLEE
jgi:hypothetical protein